jgi:hypothetical protein
MDNHVLKLYTNIYCYTECTDEFQSEDLKDVGCKLQVAGRWVEEDRLFLDRLSLALVVPVFILLK